MTDAVELIAYADRLGGSLAGLRELLAGRFSGLFGGVHVLPFFRPYDGADAGFDPEDHTTVDARLGEWADVADLAGEFDLMIDVIVNHVSSSSSQFLDWLEKGAESEFDGMFLTLDSVFPAGVAEAELTRLYRPRPGLPFTPYALADGTKRLVWTTFTSQQVDLDVHNDQARAYLLRVLDTLAEVKATRVRLDAVGYAVKTPGSTSFMTAETFSFIDEVTAWCRERGLEVLVEVHSHYQRQVEIARKVDRVYDFALPPLILYSLTSGDGDPLRTWWAMRPANAVTVLDTHDGIGVIDVGADVSDKSRAGLLTPEQIDELVEAIHHNSAETSRAATGTAASNVDLYQVNCTFYDALARDDDRYLLARALQFWTPGVPQVYYVGLLAGSNDMELLTQTGVGRDVNRHYYHPAEIDDAMRRPVVRALTGLIRFRNAHPAFAGDFTVDGDGPRLTVTRSAGVESAVLVADLATGQAVVQWTDGGKTREASLRDLADW
ncbi:MAG: sucrose phosphorylase [Nocardioides sp.]